MATRPAMPAIMMQGWHTMIDDDTRSNPQAILACLGYLHEEAKREGMREPATFIAAALSATSDWVLRNETSGHLQKPAQVAQPVRRAHLRVVGGQA